MGIFNRKKKEKYVTHDIEKINNFINDIRKLQEVFKSSDNRITDAEIVEGGLRYNEKEEEEETYLIRAIGKYEDKFKYTSQFVFVSEILETEESEKEKIYKKYIDYQTQIIDYLNSFDNTIDKGEVT